MIFWSLITLGILVLSAGLLTLVCNLVIIQAAATHIVDSPEKAPPSQCAIVLGARVFSDGDPTAMLADRLEVAIELYELGKVDKLLLSGDHGQDSYDEVNVMLEYVLARGIPEEDVFTDHAGFDTYDTMYRARDVFLVKKAIIVTQSFHLSRAVYTARELGLDAVGVSSDLRVYKHPTRNALREVLARVKAVMDIHIFHSEPKYLGTTHPITGDGRSTRG